MSPLLKNVATITTLAATALLLIADSEPEVCSRSEEDVTFVVKENTCGEDGTLHLVVGQDSCRADVEVAPKLGLPASVTVPETGALWNGGWILNGEMEVAESPDGGSEPPSDGGAPSVRVFRSCESLPGVGGILRLECKDRRVSPGQAPEQVSQYPACSAVLTQQ
ncbi:hypothetical protein [Pyxidicoccus caerfyrddinensis]|uniref:hypothetical protein n=1 Tax=Pyxidicoccus caerfyrddinensis TaxID=2709663 RepID=UPI0013DB2B1C|nr:hypothetical protein [Pyxidicoccus caerfyrddinensis]